MENPQIISFTVPVVPVPMPRARAATRGGHATMYTPKTIGTDHNKRPHPILFFKHAVAECCAKVYDGPPIEGPLAVRIECVMPRPNAMCWKTKPMPSVFETRRGSGDWDNIAKSVCDALNGRLFVDDSQIAVGTVIKRIGSADEQPHVKVDFLRLGDVPPQIVSASLAEQERTQG